MTMMMGLELLSSSLAVGGDVLGNGVLSGADPVSPLLAVGLPGDPPLSQSPPGQSPVPPPPPLLLPGGVPPGGDPGHPPGGDGIAPAVVPAAPPAPLCAGGAFASTAGSAGWQLHPSLLPANSLVFVGTHRHDRKLSQYALLFVTVRRWHRDRMYADCAPWWVATPSRVRPMHLPSKYPHSLLAAQSRERLAPALRSVSDAQHTEYEKKRYRPGNICVSPTGTPPHFRGST